MPVSSHRWAELPMAGHLNARPGRCRHGRRERPAGMLSVRHRVMRSNGELRCVSEQGIEMGRPSFISIRIQHSGDEITEVHVGGTCHYMGEGSPTRRGPVVKTALFGNIGAFAFRHRGLVRTCAIWVPPHSRSKLGSLICPRFRLSHFVLSSVAAVLFAISFRRFPIPETRALSHSRPSPGS